MSDTLSIILTIWIFLLIIFCTYFCYRFIFKRLPLNRYYIAGQQNRIVKTLGGIGIVLWILGGIILPFYISANMPLGVLILGWPIFVSIPIIFPSLCRSIVSIIGGFIISYIGSWETYYTRFRSEEGIIFCKNIALLEREVLIYLEGIKTTYKEPKYIFFNIILCSIILISYIIEYVLGRLQAYDTSIFFSIEWLRILDLICIVYGVYILYKYILSEIPRIRFFILRTIRSRDIRRLLWQLNSVELRAERIIQSISGKLTIDEYINLVQQFAADIEGVEQFRNRMIHLTSASWIEKRYYFFPENKLLLQGFSNWINIVNKEVSSSLKQNLVHIGEEIYNQKVRIQQLPTNSIEFAGITELQVKRLADLEKRLVI